MNRHIIVIGGGVAGLATAWALARRGARVEVLERGELGRESSWAGAGLLSLLLPWDYPAELNELAEHSLALYPDWIAGIRAEADTDPEFRRTGMLVLPPYDGARAAPGAPLPAGLAPFGPGLWLPEVPQVRNPRLLKALREALTRRGVGLHDQLGAVGLDAANGRVEAAVAGSRRWQGDLYVVAAGAWSSELLGPLAAGLPIRPMRGQILLYRAAPDRLPCVVYQGGHYLVPRADGHILAGSTLEDVGFDKRTTAEAATELAALVARVLPDVAAGAPVRHWAGLRPGSPGNVPIVDRHPELANLYVNAGQFRYGVTLAPACAEHLADLVEGKTPKFGALRYAWPLI
ncbi:NAD(P)/FAD-dependent oxidoreductase [Parasulfuritortus cantonensis]|uniref:NAD(P)/FAD-dependent oxidoreductase n=1 Tax=Parasulfuritortus cantonensis TaxID=2528202 RepID=UPI0014055F24|nr:FAD-dependent oxidoreductase [Parasulfuritortus cantonensis]